MLCCFVHHNQGNTIFSVNSPMETASEWQSILLPLTVIFSRRIFSTVCSGSVPAIRISPRKRSPAPVKAIFRNVQFRMLPKPGGCFNSSEYFSQTQNGYRQCNFAEPCRFSGKHLQKHKNKNRVRLSPQSKCL